MKEKQHITINIADATGISLDIPRDKEALARKAGQNVNRMWAQLGSQYKDLKSHDLLAMVAFRYAQVYYELLDKVQAEEEALAEVEKAFDKILLSVD